MIPRYTLPEMGAIWTDEARFEQMLRVEIAVARAQVERGTVPAAALRAIEARATVNVARIAEIERTTDHDVIAFVSQVAETVGAEGRYLHLGLTSSATSWTPAWRSSSRLPENCCSRIARV